MPEPTVAAIEAFRGGAIGPASAVKGPVLGQPVFFVAAPIDDGRIAIWALSAETYREGAGLTIPLNDAARSLLDPEALEGSEALGLSADDVAAQAARDCVAEAQAGRRPEAAGRLPGPRPPRRRSPRRRSLCFRPMSAPELPAPTRPDDLILVAGGGGFIGAQLVSALLADGHTNVRAVDVRPLEDWYQVSEEADNRVLDLQLGRRLQSRRSPAPDSSTTSPPTWAAWGSSRTTRRSACCRC